MPIESAKMKFRKTSAIVSSLFVLYPLGSMPFVVYDMKRRRFYAFFLWALFMGLLAVLYPPTGDLYRYTMDFETYRGIKFENFLSYLSLKFDYFLPFLSYGLGEIGLNFDISRFIYNFMAYILIGRIYIDVTNSNPHLRGQYSWIFLIMFVPFSISTYLQRFGLSIVLFTYGTYLIEHKKQKRGWWFVLWSIFNHATFIVFAVMLLFRNIKLLYFSKPFLWLVAISIFFAGSIGSDFFLSLLSFLPVDIVNHFSTYLDGYQAGEFLQDHSVAYRIGRFMTQSVSYVAMAVYVIKYRKGANYSNIVNMIFIACVISVPFSVIHYRLLMLLLFNIKIYCLINYTRTVSFRNAVIWLCCFSIFSNILGLWSTRRQLCVSNIEKVFYSSSIQCLSHTYDKEWIRDNVYADGNFKHD